MGISTPKEGLRQALWLLPQAERKASAGQQERQHNALPFVGCMSTNHPLKTLSISSQSSLDSPMEFADDSKTEPSILDPRDMEGHGPNSETPERCQSPPRVPDVLESQPASPGDPSNPLTATVDSLT